VFKRKKARLNQIKGVYYQKAHLDKGKGIQHRESSFAASACHKQCWYLYIFKGFTKFWCKFKSL